MRLLTVLGSIALLAACQAQMPPPAEPAAPAATTPPDATAAAPAPAPPVPAESTFAGRVWRAQAGGAVEAGTTYAFLDDGTLVIQSASGTPMVGAWAQADGKLTMTEEGVTYPIDVLQLDERTFRLRSNNPGGAVEITLDAAPDVPLPTAPAR